MSNFHVHRCVVHQPNSVRRESKHFHKPPRTVTEENQKFWKGAPLGGSICKECWKEFSDPRRDRDRQTETSSGENMVCKYLLT
jgi:hypothetical protein